MDEPNSERIITPMSKSLVQAIDDFRFGNRVASRAEAIRQLIERGLRAAKAEKPAKAQAR
jgi:metal-responsive CopG/Arc/MetJ family transcriptional regulator